MRLLKLTLTRAFILGLLGSATAHATPGWVQQPGNATQISVGASDYPFILDTNGYVQYLGRATTDPNCHFSICPQSDRQWVMATTQTSGSYVNSNSVRMKTIATDLYGQVWSLDEGDGLWVGFGSATGGFDYELSAMVAKCASSLAPGFMQYPSQWNHAFGYPDGKVSFNPPLSRPYAPLYVTGCDSSSLYTTDLTYHGVYDSNGVPFQSITSDGWQQLDTGESQVTMFTVDGTADRVPWIVAPMSNGRPTVWAWNDGNVQWVPPPLYNGQPVAVVYATDHYVVAHNHVYQWNGDAYGNQGWPVWIELTNSFPDDGTIVQIAYSAALPGTADGTVGPSELWMVDSNTNIWYWGDVGPVK